MYNLKMEKKPKKLALGFVGRLHAGKGVTISYLVDKYGFYASSCSDRIREEIRREGKEINRDNLQATAGRLRVEFGPDVLAKRTWEEIQKSGLDKVAVDSIRGKEEAEFFKKVPGFILVAIVSDPKVRFERVLAQKRESDDPVSWDEFLKTDERDDNQEGRNISACMTLADYKIDNNGTKEELYKKIDELIDKLNE